MPVPMSKDFADPVAGILLAGEAVEGDGLLSGAGDGPDGEGESTEPQSSRRPRAVVYVEPGEGAAVECGDEGGLYMVC